MRQALLALALFVPVLGLSAQDVGNPPAFEVASIKPNKSGDRNGGGFVQPGGRYTATNITLEALLRSAYGVHSIQIIGGPSWINAEPFDIVAKAEGNQPTQVFRDQARLMLRTLLADRFMLTMHRETRELPTYALVVDRRDGNLGPRLRPSDTAECAAVKTRPPIPSTSAADPLPCGAGFARPARLGARGLALSDLITSISNVADRIVLDRTGLTGSFDWDLQWTPEQSPSPVSDGASDSISLVTALQEQLGLKLEATRSPVEVLVIDSVERPTPD